MLKLALLFYLCTYVSVLVAGTLVWNVAREAGIIDDLSSFVAESTGSDDFELFGDQILRATAIAGIILAVAGAFLTTLAAALFNLISELVGGVRLTVLEEEPPRSQPG